MPFTWDDIYAAVGLYQEKLNNQELLDLTVTFIDVGQGDSILIHTKDTNILIDTGPKGNAQNIYNVIRALNIEKLDYLIITHRHDDHKGSLDDLRKLVSIDQEIIPTNETKMVGISQNINDLTLEFLGPVYISDNLNNMSLVIKLTYKNVSFLLMGDAESEEEANLIRTYNAETLKADVLKVGHHGSDSSSSEAFLNVVQPSYAVISVGADNEFGHPHEQTLDNLNQVNAKLYRTDRDGTILCTTDGEKIVFHRLE
ncbi:MAG: ComEC/Rec2 family competence protein [Clostridia bacterium]|nr:ComEC/Rec2 family competence protein [Clostridia bacterium]